MSPPHIIQQVLQFLMGVDKFRLGMLAGPRQDAEATFPEAQALIRHCKCRLDIPLRHRQDKSPFFLEYPQVLEVSL